MHSTRTQHPVRRRIPFLLVFLFVGTFLGVVMLGTRRPSTLQEKLQSLHAHQSGYYFMEGELLAQKLAPAGAHDWPGWTDFHQSDAHYLGNDVWHAFGTVAFADDAGPSHTWEAYVAGPDAVPLFVRVGDNSTGDRNDALRRAGPDAKGP